MKKDKAAMDAGTIIVIIILIAAALCIAAAVVLLVGKWRADEAAAYEQHMAARLDYDRALITAAKVLVVGRFAYITRGVEDNRILYDTVAVDGDGTPILTDAIDGAAMNAHNIASQLVSDSIRKRGINGVQLLTAEEWEAQGQSRIKHGLALEYLKGLNTIKITQGGKASSQGTFVKEGNLQGLMLDLSVSALPLAMGQSVPKA